MYKDILQEIGLNSNEAVVYEYLIRHGEGTAGQINKETPIKRGVIYNALSSLKDKKLISEKKTSKSVSKFVPEHPNKLNEFVESKEREVTKAQNSLEANLPTIVSDFNLISGKPGVQIYEGKDGIQKVLNDSLTSKEEILAYGDIESIEKYISDINKKYVAQRKKLGIKKRGLMLDNPFARKTLKNYNLAVTDTKLIKMDAAPFQNVMQIYDGKVSYITLNDKFLMGIIISDPHIYQMHRYLFELMWQKTEGVEFKK